MANPTSLTISSNTYSLVQMPSSPAPKAVSFTASDTIGEVQSPFTLQTQEQEWPGADLLEAQVTLPPMNRLQAGFWIAFLLQCRGKLCVFNLGDPDAVLPMGSPHGFPVVDGSVTTNNAPTSKVLFTRGWTPNQFRLLLPTDYMQIGNRLYRSLDIVNSDANGDAQINIWPSIRETPADGAAISLRNTTGLFHLSDNTRTWNRDVVQQYGISFKATEVR